MRFLLPLFFLLLIGAQASAQNSSQVLLTWEARNYVPSSYSGKNLATPGTDVVLSSELLQGDRIRDSRQAFYRWFVDGDLFQKGAGLKEIVLPIKKRSGDSYSVRAEVFLGDDEFSGVIQVPVSDPEIIISRVGDRSLRVLPYFFPISSPRELRVDWEINYDPADRLFAHEEFSLAPNVYGNTLVRVTAYVSQFLSSLARDRIRLNIQ